MRVKTLGSQRGMAEAVARAREEAIAAQIDAMGPALTVVPRGITAGALARLDLGEDVLPEGIEGAARAVLGRDLRAVERRLVVHREVMGARVPVLGVEAGALPAASGGARSAALGSELARRLEDVSSVTLAGRGFRISGAMPSTGSGEDVAVLVPISELQALAGTQGANELRLFLRAGVSPREAEARLRVRYSRTGRRSSRPGRARA